MIEITRGNILRTDAEALVNTVNCVGHMGKGIALQFKKAYPENYEAYRKACDAKEVRPGRMFVYETGSVMNPRYIINFPTKRHWRGRSRLEDIDAGLEALVEIVREYGIRSVAIPPLGCGLGGLSWQVVQPMIRRAFQGLPETRVVLFEPSGSPAAKTMPVRTKRPGMTVARALLIKVMRQYSDLAYRMTLLEIQKMAYFLQESGEPLRLRYVAGSYGPYAHNLNKVLEILEAHFIRGYGDSQQRDVEIEILPGASKAAEQFLSDYHESVSRLERVGTLIEGYETPYGMELLASVHWLALHGERKATDEQSAVRLMHGWTDRKRSMFQPAHIRMAWDRLTEEGWLPMLNDSLFPAH